MAARKSLRRRSSLASRFHSMGVWNHPGQCFTPAGE